eukprot:3327428-Pleurochrysis_carterae.AAC.1
MAVLAFTADAQTRSLRPPQYHSCAALMVAMQPFEGGRARKAQGPRSRQARGLTKLWSHRPFWNLR